MKMLNEIKKESGININLATNIQSEKASKLKFEPNVNLKRNFIPNVELEKNTTQSNEPSLINLNQSINNSF